MKPHMKKVIKIKETIVGTGYLMIKNKPMINTVANSPMILTKEPTTPLANKLTWLFIILMISLERFFVWKMYGACMYELAKRALRSAVSWKENLSKKFCIKMLMNNFVPKIKTIAADRNKTSSWCEVAPSASAACSQKGNVDNFPGLWIAAK